MGSRIHALLNDAAAWLSKCRHTYSTEFQSLKKMFSRHSEPVAEAWGWLALMRLGLSLQLPELEWRVGQGACRASHGLRVVQGKFSGEKSGYHHPKKGIDAEF